jgi:3-phosphoshikimate 1-carboxyvinyltransferase
VSGDELTITPGRLHASRIESHGDHRIAMSFGLVGLMIPGVEVSAPLVVNKTWPGYWEMLSALAEKQG